MHAAEHRPGIAIDCERAGEIDDDLLIGLATKLLQPAVDKGAGNRRVEDALIDRAPPDAGMRESAREQEVPSQVDVERAESDREVRWLDEHGSVPLGGIGGSGDAIRYAIGSGGGLAREDAVVLDIGDPAEGSERRRTRLPETTMSRNRRGSEERHGRERKGSEHSTKATF